MNKMYIIIVFVFMIGLAVNVSGEESLIPSWIKNTAQYWTEGKSSDSEFIDALEYLIKNGIIKVNSTREPGIIYENGIVTKIVDGDTIYTDLYKIRLSLINTPERGQTGFSEATAFTANLCPLGSVILINQDNLQPYDKYGRMVAKVSCADKVLNSELLDNKHANILKNYCSKSEFSAESWARNFGC